jgi:hypothetical protein
MRRRLFLFLMFVGITLLYSCNNAGKQAEVKKVSVQNKALQKKDGTISLDISEAACYSDMNNPSCNTAEWDVVILKSGRYNVWMTSVTKDTTNLKYRNSVMINIQDNRLEAHPVCNKIIQNPGEVSPKFYRADSYIGSLFIQDTGLLNVQVISEKIIPKDYKKHGSSEFDDSKLISVMLTPINALMEK